MFLQFRLLLRMRILVIFIYRQCMKVTELVYTSAAEIIVRLQNDDFIFQNSWGKSYKDNGRYHIPASYIDEAYVLVDEVLSMPFSDVQESEWYYKPIKTAYFSGVINGTTETTFEPDIPITRAEVAAVAYRVLETAQNSVNAYLTSTEQDGRRREPINLLPGGQVLCPDVPSDEWYADAVSRLLCTGIFTGDSEGTFRPNDNITRAEAAAVSVRNMKKIDDMFVSMCRI